MMYRYSWLVYLSKLMAPLFWSMFNKTVMLLNRTSVKDEHISMFM